MPLSSEVLTSEEVNSARADEIERKKFAYRTMFGGSSAHLVMADLRKFCHAEDTIHYFDDAGRTDMYGTAQLEGRRQVWLRIQAMINAPEADAAEDRQTTADG